MGTADVSLPRRGKSSCAASDDEDGGRRNAWRVAEEDPASAAVVLEKRRCELHGELSTDFAHRVEDRKLTEGITHDLVSDDRRLELHQLLYVVLGRHRQVVERADDRSLP